MDVLRTLRCELRYFLGRGLDVEVVPSAARPFLWPTGKRLRQEPMGARTRPVGWVESSGPPLELPRWSESGTSTRLRIRYSTWGCHHSCINSEVPCTSELSCASP